MNPNLLYYLSQLLFLLIQTVSLIFATFQFYASQRSITFIPTSLFMHPNYLLLSIPTVSFIYTNLLLLCIPTISFYQSQPSLSFIPTFSFYASLPTCSFIPFIHNNYILYQSQPSLLFMPTFSFNASQLSSFINPNRLFHTSSLPNLEF